jgi:hypothetical protein
LWEKYALRRRGDHEIHENNVFDPEKKVIEIKLKNDELPSHPAKYGLLLCDELIHRGFCKWHLQGSNPTYANAGFIDAVYDMQNAIQSTISQPGNRWQARWWAGIVTDLITMSENLNLSDSSPLRARHKCLFEHTEIIKKIRNWLAHHKEVDPDPKRWERVWKAINIELKQSLLSELERVIKQEATCQFKDPRKSKLKVAKNMRILDMDDDAEDRSKQFSTLREEHTQILIMDSLYAVWKY